MRDATVSAAEAPEDAWLSRRAQFAMSSSLDCLPSSFACAIMRAAYCVCARGGKKHRGLAANLEKALG